MKKLIVASAFLAALCLPALAGQNGQGGSGNNNAQGGHTVGAPGPVVGAGVAGLPVIAVFGAYWLVRRHRRKSGAV